MKVSKISEVQKLKYNIQRRALINQLNNTVIKARQEINKIKNIANEASIKVGTIINIYV